MVRPWKVLLVALLALLSGCRPSPPVGAWRIVPRDAQGALGKNSGSEAELKRLYGDANVTRGIVNLGEGKVAPGTILFPGDSLRRVDIVWEDSLHHAIPSRVFLRGGRSLWRLPDGVTLGLSLKDLERMNGRPFTLSGFGWDYEGAVLSWSGGALDTALTPEVTVSLRPGPEDRTTPEASRLGGDKPYASSLPDMRALNPRVYAVTVSYQHLSAPGASARAHAPTNEIRESEQGRTIPIEQDARFTVILDRRTHPQQTLDVLPRGALQQEGDLPDVGAPLYAVRFAAVKTGTCLVTAKGFWVRIQVREKPRSAAPPNP